MKKFHIIYLAIITVLLALLIGCVAVGADFVGGFSRLDLDESGNVDISDVTYLLNYLSKGCAHEEIAIDPGTPATCTEAGLSGANFCKVCGEILSAQEELPALGHNFVNGVCRRCGRSEFTQGLAYARTDNGYAVTGYFGADLDIVIPGEYNGLPVVAIGDEAFYDHDEITSVVIPEGVTEIGSYAFAYCYDLREVDLPSSLTALRDDAFYDCSSLTAIDLPAGLTTIEEYAFGGCQTLESVVLPEGVTEILQDTFSGCYALREVVLPESLTTIGAHAFDYCTALFSIRIPSGVQTISDSAFIDCYKLVEVINDSELDIVCGSGYHGEVALYALTVHDGESVIENADGIFYYPEDGKYYILGSDETVVDLVVPATYKETPCEIYPYAFSENEHLRTAVISEGFTVIPEEAFSFSDGLKTVRLPSTLTVIGKSAFRDCDSLMSVNIPVNVETIRDGAFASCYKLVEVINESSLPLVCGSEEYGCAALYALGIHTGESTIEKVGDFLFYPVDGENYLFSYTGSGTAVTLPLNYHGETYAIAPYVFYYSDLVSIAIPEGVTAIGNNAFYSCYYLKSAVIPESVVSIGDYAFYCCTDLHDVIIGSGVRTIGEYAFCDCYDLYEIVIPEGVETISDGLFDYDRSLTYVTIPSSVKTIGYAAFNGCDSLYAVYFGGTEEEWAEVEIDIANSELNEAYIRFAD